ncbi:hypothetical protein RQP46_007992 [Phenoliferia psychrophenolica]
MLPTLPLELTSEILEFATLDLVEQERHDSTVTGQANAFLLSASLVSHTWRNIAQPLLTKHGLINPSRADNFISEVERAGVKDSLPAVRIGVPASRRMMDVDARAGGIGLRRILEELPALKALEFVGQRLRILKFVVTPNQVTTLSFAASNRENFEALLFELYYSFTPLRLTIIEDPVGFSNDARRLLQRTIVSPDYLDKMVGIVQDISFTITTKRGVSNPIFVATTRLYAPNLEVLKILWDPEGVQSSSTIIPEDKILDHVSNLAALKIEAEHFAAWASQRKYC